MRYLILSLIFVSVSIQAQESIYEETRCCVEIERDANGVIKRSWKVKHEFRKHWPCPTGASIYEACTGWQIDHVIPLACGGKDEVSNMQWLPVEIKTCSGELCKDRFERKIYCNYGY